MVSMSALRPAAALPRRGRPPKQAAEGLRDQIMASARELFLRQGFAATSVQQIAEHAGATKRTLYVKIGDKESLFRAVIDDVLQDWRHTVDGAASSGSLQTRLEQIGLQLLSAVLAPDMLRLNRVLLSEVYRFPALTEALMHQIDHGPMPQLARLLMQERGGRHTPAREDEVAARLFYDMISGAPLRVALTGRRPAFEMPHADWVHYAVQVFLQGWEQAGR